MSEQQALEILASYHHLVGKRPDSEVAVIAGVSRSAVYAYRQIHEIPLFERRGVRPAIPRRAPVDEEVLGVAPPIPGAEAAPPAEAPPGDAPGEAASMEPGSPLDPWLGQLGCRPDGEIATAAGVARATVMSYRRRHGIPGYVGDRIVPNRGSAGQERNAETAGLAAAGEDEAVGMPPVEPLASGVKQAIVFRRSRLDAHLDKVGVLPDWDVAERVGVTKEAVRQYRVRRGIPAAWETSAAHGAEPGAEVRRDARRGARSPLALHLDILGKVPDSVVAERAGVSPKAVVKFRKRHGIAGWTPQVPAGASEPAPVREAGTKRRPSRIAAYADLLGVLPDQEVARRAGVTYTAVRNYRVAKGIPAGWKVGGGRATAPAAVVGPPVPTPAAPPRVGSGYRVSFRDADGNEREYCVTADDLAEAAARALPASATLGVVTGIRLVGEALIR